MMTRNAILSSWQASVRSKVERPIPASIAGAALASAGGNVREAIESLETALEYMAAVAVEEESKRQLTGTGGA